MSDVAIRAEGLGKRYRIRRAQRLPYETLRDQLSRAVSGSARSLLRLARGKTHAAPETTTVVEDLWAVRDVDFEIKRGEAVGIIGRNGAGKSTLLKILSKITEPSSGYADIYGRVGSLLEVGTGFHPELTGRENIFLSGAILGMRRAEIRQKFDDIVSFAEVSRFVDTAVKHYSSGMYLRLAFAVAAHLDPEILLVDEVLAVGDSRFQKKCLNKMEEVGRQGRTVLFVSHSMPAITRLCRRALLIDEGKLVQDGRSDSVVASYLHGGMGHAACREWHNPEKAPRSEYARLFAVRVRNEEGQISDSIDIRQPVSVEMEYEVLQGGFVLLPHFHFYNDQGVHVFPVLDLDPEWRGRRRPPGRYLSKAWIPGNFLSEGSYFVHAHVITLDPIIQFFNAVDAVAINVVDSIDGDTARGDYVGRLGGVIRPVFKWETMYNETGAEFATDQAACAPDRVASAT